MRPWIRLYPRSWRKRYGDEFAELLDSTPRNPGTAVDIVRGATDAQIHGGSLMRRVTPVALLLAVDVVIGWLNYHASDDVQPVAAALIVAGFGFTFWRPRLAWLFVPALWLAIPVSSIVGYANNYHPGLVKAAPLYETLVALIPTALGAAMGAGARWIFRQSGAAER